MCPLLNTYNLQKVNDGAYALYALETTDGRLGRKWLTVSPFKPLVAALVLEVVPAPVPSSQPNLLPFV